MVHLDILPRSDGEATDALSHNLVAVHRNGQIASYSAQLEDELWTGSTLEASSPRPEQTDVLLHAAVLSEGEARKCLLKQREDILKTNVYEGERERSLLFVLYSNTLDSDEGQHHLMAKLFALDENADKLGRSGASWRLNELISRRMPVPESFRKAAIETDPKAATETSLDVRTATLYQQNARGLAIYDLEGFAPRLAHIFKRKSKHKETYIGISPNLLATAVDQNVDFVGLPYCGIQASVQLQADIDGSKMTRILTYSAQQNIVVLLTGRRIVAIPVPSSFSNLRSRNRNRDGLLISSLGRSLPRRSADVEQRSIRPYEEKLGQAMIFSGQDRDWNKRELTLNNMLENGNQSGFHGVINRELDAGTEGIEPVRLHRIYYILSRIFRVSEGRDNKDDEDHQSVHWLQVASWPAEICQSLVQEGLFTNDHIESALKHTGIMPLHAKLAPGALVAAVEHWDPTLNVLHSVCLGPSTVDAVGIGHALLAVTRHLKSVQSSTGQNLLANTDLNSSKENRQPLQLTNGEPSTNGTSQSTGPKGGPDDVSRRLLYSLLLRIKSFPSEDMAHSIRSVLNNSDMRSLIDIMRVEMADNGWLSFCGDEYQTGPQPDHTDDQITLLAHALNILLDSLGPAGWVSQSSSKNDLAETADTIAYMKAEVSAALEGIQQATYLRQILGEALLCGKETLRPPSKTMIEYAEQDNPASTMMKPMTLSLERDSSLLPLGLKPKAKISKTKVGAGGEIIQRSQRDIGQLKSRVVGKYSFERIEF